MSVPNSPKLAKRILLGCTVDMSTIFYDGLIQRLSGDGWEVHLATGQGPHAERLFKEHAEIHSISMERGVSPLLDIVSFLRWMALIRRVRPHVLYVGTPKASLLATIAGRLARVPAIVYTLHGLREEGTSGSLRTLLSATEALTLRSAHQVLAVSPSLKGALLRLHPWAGTKTRVLGYGSATGVDLNRFTPAPPIHGIDGAKIPSDIIEGRLTLGYVGRLHSDKGGSFLLELLTDSSLAHLQPHLLIVGGFDDDRLEAQVTNLINAGLVTMTGWTDTPEVYMPLIDILVHPTLREGIGMVILEAQSCGVPVVTNAVTGTVDAMEDGVGGLFAETNSIASWAAAVRRLADDPGLRAQMGVRGRAFVDSRYSRPRVVALQSHYLSELLQETSGTAPAGQVRP